MALPINITGRYAKCGWGTPHQALTGSRNNRYVLRPALVARPHAARLWAKKPNQLSARPRVKPVATYPA